MLGVPKSIIQDQTFSDYNNELNILSIFLAVECCFIVLYLPSSVVGIVVDLKHLRLLSLPVFALLGLYLAVLLTAKNDQKLTKS